MTRIVSWLIVLSAIGGFLAVAYVALRSRAESGQGMPAYSVYSHGPDGLEAAAELLRKLGWEPIALTLPVQATEQRDAKNKLLILVEPEEAALLPGLTSGLSPADANGMLHWVEQGNTLLLCSRQTIALHEALQVGVAHDDPKHADDEIDVALGEAGGYTEGIERLMVEGPNALTSNIGLPLWWLGDDAGATVIGHGKGRVIVIAETSLLTLRGLRRADNARFLVNLARLHAGDGKVYFDEYHHGLRSGGGFWAYVRAKEQHWTVLLLVIVVGMAGWSVAVRLGQAVPAPREVQADSVDYASAVARIYQRTGARHLLAKTLSHDMQACLTRHLHLRRAAQGDEVLAAWRQQHAAGSDQPAQEILSGVARLRDGQVSASELLAWTRTFDRFKSEVLRDRRA